MQRAGVWIYVYQISLKACALASGVRERKGGVCEIEKERGGRMKARREMGERETECVRERVGAN